MKIFIATGFDPLSRRRAKSVEESLRTLGIEVVYGDKLSGDRISDGVKKRIDESNCLIALLTRHEPKKSGGWTTHPWVMEEAIFAYAKKIKVLYVVEKNVALGGIAGDVEKVMFNPHSFETALPQILLFALKQKSPDSEVVRELPSRTHYLDEIIHHVREAKRKIILCVHTLKPAESGNQVKMLHEALSESVRRVKDIRVLAPSGLERAKAAYQLNRLGIPLRHMLGTDYLDMSFSVFDSIHTVLPIESGLGEETVSGITVKSAKLSDLLTNLFDEFWWNYEALAYPDYIRFTADRILKTVPSMKIADIAEKVDIPEKDLRELLPTLRATENPAYIFIIGKPASGKTTVADAIIQGLERNGIPKKQIYYFNDYQALYERFLGDSSHRLFEPTERGGFALRDSSVLESVLQQANLTIKSGRSFFKVFLIEFARDSYLQAFMNFDKAIFYNCRVIHVKCSDETCMSRNEQRRSVSEDRRSGYVSPEVISHYYSKEDIGGLADALKLQIETIDTDNISLDQVPGLIENKLSDYIKQYS